MTKYWDDNIRKGNIRPPKQPSTSDKVVITSNDDSVKSYQCGNCNHIIKTRKTEGTMSCPNCTAELEIEDTRKKSKLEIPRGCSGDNTVYPHTTPAPTSPFASEKVEPKGAFLEL